MASFARGKLHTIQNPKTRAFTDLASQFKESWGGDLIKYVNDKGRREAIDAIMSNRHRIAHGNTSTITVVQIKEYFKKAVEVVDFIENQCGSAR